MEGLGSGRPALAAWRAALALHKVLTDRFDEGGREAHALATHFDRVPRDFFWLSAATVLAEAIHLCDDADGAAPLYEALTPYASRHTQHSFAACWGSVERPLGLLAETLGRRDVAEARLRAALAANCATRAPVLIAATECDLGELLLSGDAADRERASELGATAEARVRPLGLPVLAARAAWLRG